MADKEKQENILLLLKHQILPIKDPPDGMIYPNNPENVDDLTRTTGVELTNKPPGARDKYDTIDRYRNNMKKKDNER